MSLQIPVTPRQVITPLTFDDPRYPRRSDPAVPHSHHAARPALRSSAYPASPACPANPACPASPVPGKLCAPGELCLPDPLCIASAGRARPPRCHRMSEDGAVELVARGRASIVGTSALRGSGRTDGTAHASLARLANLDGHHHGQILGCVTFLSLRFEKFSIQCELDA